MSAADLALLAASKKMADRLRVFRRMAQQARECEGRIDLDPREMWEQADEQALIDFENALHQIAGLRPLPMDIPA